MRLGPPHAATFNAAIACDAQRLNLRFGASKLLLESVSPRPLGIAVVDQIPLIPGRPPTRAKSTGPPSPLCDSFSVHTASSHRHMGPRHVENLAVSTLDRRDNASGLGSLLREKGLLIDGVQEGTGAVAADEMLIFGIVVAHRVPTFAVHARPRRESIRPTRRAHR
jgi:hypothetical protein